MKLLPVILSGGSGTRLWPLSRKRWPKQFLDLSGEGDPFTQTLERIERLASHLPPSLEPLPPLAVGSAGQRELLAERLPEGARAILEPVARNTAPAATLAALLEPEAVLLVLPADHLLEAQPFAEAAARGAELAAGGFWVTFGIVPSRPETGYGYLERGEEVEEGVFRLKRFVEKPDFETALRYLERGSFFWNSGMFLFRADRWLEALERLHPEMVAACREAVARGRSEGRWFLPEREALARSPAESIDYAVMERLEEVAPGKGVVLPLAARWSDIGAFSALFELFPQDGAGNLLLGDAVARDCRDSLLFGRDLLVAAVGVEELIVVATRDAVLVLPRTEAQRVRELFSELEREGREEVERPLRERHPWGWRERLEEGSALYRLEAERKLLLSGREPARLLVLGGTGLLLLPDQRHALRRGDFLHLPEGYRAELIGQSSPLTFLLMETG